MAPGRTRTRSLRSLAFGQRRSPSPTFSDASHVTDLNFEGPIITRQNLRSSLQAYEQLMSSCASYRTALMTMSQATSDLADAFESCAALKGPAYESVRKLQAASGLHHLIGNHWHVLAETLDKNFEKPLLQHLETYRTIVNDRSAAYEKALKEKSRIIRETELRNMNKRERNLQSFRDALTVLQRQVDELDELKSNHYQEIIEHESEVWNVVSGKTSIVVRSEMDVFERFTAKTSDPVIDQMLQAVPDPFDSYGPPQAEDQIFSILAPLSIMSASTSSLNNTQPTPIYQATSSESTDTSASSSRDNSWIESFPAQATSAEWADVPSSSSSPPSSVSRRSQNQAVSPPRQQRKSDNSKLRNVLSAIDERNPGKAGGSADSASTNGNNTLRGTKPEKRVKSFNWSPFSYGQSPYASSESSSSPPATDSSAQSDSSSVSERTALAMPS